LKNKKEISFFEWEFFNAFSDVGGWKLSFKKRHWHCFVKKIKRLVKCGSRK